MKNVFTMIFIGEVLELSTLITCHLKKSLKNFFCVEKPSILSSTGLKPEI